jgi:hypothetical protein
MTVTSRKYFTDWFVANGVNKDWGFDFTILKQDDVVLLIRDGTDDTTIVEVTTDLGFFPADDFASGTVRYPVLAAALAVGKQVRILRRAAYLQQEKIGKEGKFLPLTHEKALDLLTILTQQVDNNLELAVRVPVGDTPLTFVSEIAENKALIRQGNFIVAGPTVSEISSAQGYAEAAISAAGASATSAGASATSAETSETAAGIAVGAATTAEGFAESVAEDLAIFAPVSADIALIADNIVDIQNAAENAALAKGYATEDEDVPVETGPNRYSAKHWSAKAEEFAQEASGYAGVLRPPTISTSDPAPGDGVDGDFWYVI